MCVCTLVKIHTLFFKQVHFILCKLHLGKVDFFLSGVF